MWLGRLSALAEHFHVVAIDRPGHGESEHVRLTDASVWRQAEIVRGFGRTLGLERPTVVGHSFGVAVALAHGMAYRLVLRHRGEAAALRVGVRGSKDDRPVRCSVPRRTADVET